MKHRFRGFELVDRIGSGGMSTIYLGIQTALDRKVAIKLLHPAFADDEQFIARFEREAKSASSLGHPNVVTIIDFGSENGAYYIVMELVDGADLRSIFQRCDRIPPEITLVLLEEICHGLEAAHEKGIVHRDIKPGNVLLSGDGRVKIADFGLARQIHDFDRMATITMTGAIVGTPAYMSPEQLAGAPVDHRTDIYSLGVMAYEFFVGERPFRATPSGVDTEQRILRGSAPPMERDGIRLPRYIVDLVSKMLAKDPDRRFPNITDLLRAVENAMDQIDDSGQLLKHRRDYLKRFAQDPAAFGRELRRRRLSRHLRRGNHFVGMGLERIHDAVEQYLAALRIDPGNPVARAALVELEREHGSGLVHAAIGRTTSVFSAEPIEFPAGEPMPAHPQPADPSRADPLLDGIDASSEFEPGELETTQSETWEQLDADKLSGGALQAPSVVTEISPDDPTELRDVPETMAAGEASDSGTWRSAEGQKDDATQSPAHAVVPPRIHPTLWTRPWLWAVLLAALIAVPSLTLGPLGRKESPSNSPTEAARSGDGDETGRPAMITRSDTSADGDQAQLRTTDDGAVSPPDPVSTDTPPPSTQVPPGSGGPPTRASGTRPKATEDAEVTPKATAPSPQASESVPLSVRPTSPARTEPERGGSAPGFIEVRVVPLADIYIDEQLVGRRSRVVVHAADPDRPHTVEVRHPSFGTRRWPSVAAQRDTTQLVHRYRWGDIRIEWSPAGPTEIRFDETLVGEVPSFSRQVALGEHRVQIRRAGYQIAQVQLSDAIGTRMLPGPDAAGALETYLFEVGPGETTRVNVVFEKE